MATHHGIELPHIAEIQDDDDLQHILYPAYFSGARFDRDGNFIITMTVAPQFRDLAIDIASYAGYQFWMMAWRPKKKED